MAYTVTKCDVGGSTANGYHYEYLCESADDIADLPTGADSTEISKPAPGSLALLEDGTVYILKNNREWSEFSMAGGGGGSTGGGGMLVVTATYDENTDITTFNKTWQEIADAPLAVIVLSIPFEQTVYHNLVGQTFVRSDPTSYALVILGVESGETFLVECDAADAYPSYQG